MSHTPPPESREEATIALIQKKGVMRSHALATALSIDHDAVIELLSEACSCGLLVACDVLVMGLPPGKEYRPGSGMAVTFKPAKDFMRQYPTRPDAAPPAAAPETQEIRADIPINETRQESPMNPYMETRAVKMAKELNVCKAVPARGFKAKAPKPRPGRKTGRQEQIVAVLETHGAPATIDELAQFIPDATRAALKQACNKAEHQGLIQSVVVKGRTKAFHTGRPAQVRQPAVTGTAKVQPKTAKVQTEVARGRLPDLPPTTCAQDAEMLPTAPFRCGIMSDGALVLDGNFSIADSGLVLSVGETRVLVDYLRRLELLGEPA